MGRPVRDLVGKVEQIIRDVNEEMIWPRFRALNSSDVSIKSAGEVVTVVDVEAERALTRRLADLLPVPVIGEEACADDPTLMEALGADRAWIIDPIDGTANFVAGTDAWAVMVALCERGDTVASWIWCPASGSMYVAERGSGAARNGQRLSAGGTLHGDRDRTLHDIRGAVLTKFLDPGTAKRVSANRSRFGELTGGSFCAGVDYPDVIGGVLDFVLYWRTRPWDHAPGALLLSESGGTARRPDGTAYRPGTPGAGLLAAVDARTWEAVIAGLLG